MASPASQPVHPVLLELVAGRPAPYWPDANALERAARAHGVVAEVQAAVERWQAPQPIRDLLQATLQTGQLRALLHLELARQLQHQAQAHGLPVRFLKGPFARASLDDANTLPPVADLDVWIEPGAWPEWTEIFAKTGLKERHGSVDPTALPREITFVDASGRHLDVHTRPVPRALAPLFPTAAAWSRRQSVELSGSAFDTLSPEDTLHLYLVSAVKDGYTRLKPFVLAHQHPSVTEAVLARRALAWLAPGIREALSYLSDGGAVPTVLRDVPKPQGAALMRVWWQALPPRHRVLLGPRIGFDRSERDEPGSSLQRVARLLRKTKPPER